MISLVATVLNEGGNIHHLLESILRQTRPPDEIVIVDGGSSDDTVAIIKRYQDKLPLRLLVEEGCNISQGRNRAITAAEGDIIAVTDAGVRLNDEWLEKIIDPLLADPQLNVVGGFFRADPQTPFETALGAATLPLENEIDVDRFLPSSRSIAFRKAAAMQIGLYPVWLDFCEDLIFDLRLLRGAGPLVFAPAALVYFSAADHPAQVFFRQYFLYARGDGKANLWFKRHLIPLSHLSSAAAGHSAGGRVGSSNALVALPGRLRRLSAAAVSPSADCNSEGWQLVHSRSGSIAPFTIPWIRIVGDLAKMIGYPVGWIGGLNIVRRLGGPIDGSVPRPLQPYC